jgi:hypothetical protein
MDGDLFEVLDAAAEQESAGQRAAQRDGRSGKRAMAPAGLANEDRGYGGHASYLVIGSRRVYESILVQMHLGLLY